MEQELVWQEVRCVTRTSTARTRFEAMAISLELSQRCRLFPRNPMIRRSRRVRSRRTRPHRTDVSWPQVQDHNLFWVNIQTSRFAPVEDRTALKLYATAVDWPLSDAPNSNICSSHISFLGGIFAF